MIKNVIFDFGGVLYDINFALTFDAFKHLGIPDFEQLFSQFNADPLFEDLETGRIRPAAFYEKIRELTSQDFSNDQIKEAWNALLIGYRKPSLDFLVSLQNNYKLFLLSNTNQIHYEHFAPQLKAQTQYHNLESFFSHAYYSHEMGRRKPDTDTFEYVLRDAGIQAEETLFIDDSYTNLPNAERLGMKTHLLQPGEKVEQLDYSTF